MGPLDERLEVAKPAGAHRAVHHAMIAAQRHRHRRHHFVSATQKKAQYYYFSVDISKRINKYPRPL